MPTQIEHPQEIVDAACLYDFKRMLAERSDTLGLFLVTAKRVAREARGDGDADVRRAMETIARMLELASASAEETLRRLRRVWRDDVAHFAVQGERWDIWRHRVEAESALEYPPASSMGQFSAQEWLKRFSDYFESGTQEFDLYREDVCAVLQGYAPTCHLTRDLSRMPAVNWSRTALAALGEDAAQPLALPALDKLGLWQAAASAERLATFVDAKSQWLSRLKSKGPDLPLALLVVSGYQSRASAWLPSAKTACLALTLEDMQLFIERWKALSLSPLTTTYLLREVESEAVAQEAANRSAPIDWLPDMMDICLLMWQTPQDPFVSKSARVVLLAEGLDDAISRGWPPTTSTSTGEYVRNKGA